MNMQRFKSSRLARAPFFHRKPALVAIVTFAFVGLVFLALSRAATSSTELEAEQAQVTGLASAIDDATASGGKALHFGTVTSPNPNPGTYRPLSNPNATQQAKNAYNFLQSIEGKNILAGQQENDNKIDDESRFLQDMTGKAPALRGRETADSASESMDPMAQAVKDWNESKQLTTMSWHLGAPPLDDNRFENADSDQSGAPNDIIDRVLQSGSNENTVYMQKLDKMAGRLQATQAANVPILWRPFHEHNGGWFWWGKARDGAAYKRLWVHMYDYFTKTKGLNNLIWVWSTAENEPPNYDWYPGDQYVDITGTDTYGGNSSTSNWLSIFNAHKAGAANKPVALTESSRVPDTDELKSGGNKMIWFLPWYRNPSFSDFSDTAMITRVYNSDYVITADEMPDLKTSF